MITKEQALQLGYRSIIHRSPCFQGQVKAEKWRVNGAAKTWKRSPERFQVPLKWGMGYSRNDYDYLTEGNADGFHLESACPAHMSLVSAGIG